MEYKTLQDNGSPRMMQEWIEKQGLDGWELVGFVAGLIYMKRPFKRGDQ